MKPYVVDLVVLAIILFELLMGLRRGLSGELFRLIGTCVVLVIGLRFYGDFGLVIADHSRLAQNREVAVALAFLLIVAGMSVCVALFRIIFTLIVTVKFNEAFDRPAGGTAGALHGAVIAAIIVFSAGLWPNEQLQPMIKFNSHFGRSVFRFAPFVTEKIRVICPGSPPFTNQTSQAQTGDSPPPEQ